MPIKVYEMGVDNRFVSIEKSLNEGDIKKIIKISKGLDRIQANFIPDERTLALLNEYYKQFPSVAFRIYGGLTTEKLDLSFLKHMPELSNLWIDFNGELENTMDISGLSSLKELFICSYKVDNFDFLYHLAQDIDDISVNLEKGNYDLSALQRYQKIKRLSVIKCKKGLETIKQLPKLRSLELRAVNYDSISFIKDSKALESLRLNLGKSSSIQMSSDSLKALGIWRVGGLEDISFLTNLPNLEVLSLDQLRNIIALPDLSECTNLKHILLDDMKNFTDLSSLKTIKHLDTVSFLSCPTAIDMDKLKDFLEHSSVKRCCFCTSSAKKNEEITALIEKCGKEEYSNFELVKKAVYGKKQFAY